MDSQTNADGFQLISQAFNNGDIIPDQFTCRGQNINPTLNIMNVPNGAKSLALIMHDPDAVGSDFTHWLLWDIMPDTQTIAPNGVPVGAVQGSNSFGENKYGGPCPPSGSGTHRYMFELYALDITLSLASGSSREKLEEAMKGHVLDHFKLTGLVESKA